MPLVYIASGISASLPVKWTILMWLFSYIITVVCTWAGQKHYMNILARDETRIFVAKKFSTTGNIMFFLFCSSLVWDGVLNQSDID